MGNVTRPIPHNPSDGMAIIMGAICRVLSISVAVLSMPPFSHQFHWQPYTPCSKTNRGKSSSLSDPGGR